MKDGFAVCSYVVVNLKRRIPLMEVSCINKMPKLNPQGTRPLCQLIKQRPHIVGTNRFACIVERKLWSPASPTISGLCSPPQQNVKLSSFTSRPCNDSKEITKILIHLQSCCFAADIKSKAIAFLTYSLDPVVSSSSSLLIAFRAETKSYPVEREHFYRICDSPLQRSTRCSFTLLQKLRRNH